MRTGERRGTGIERLREDLGRPVDGSSLALFRVGFGLIVAWEAWRFADHGRIARYYIEPEYLFRWWLFEWVRPLPGVGMYVVFALLGLAGFLLALGWRIRLNAAVLTLLLAYVFLLDKTQYLNHLYLTILLAGMLVVVPSGGSAPAWSVWLLRFQVGVPYVFGGIAKLNHDWLVRAEPLRDWLAEDTDFPLIGPLLDEEVVVRGMAAGSTALDLLAPLLLLHRRTRAPTFAAVVAFHLMNARLFGIGIFPWVMIVATTVFFPPDWPRRVADDLRAGGTPARALAGLGAAIGFWLGGWLPESFSAPRALVGAFAGLVVSWHAVRGTDRPPAPRPDAAPVPRPVQWALAAWVAVQVAVPLHHFAIPGHVSWTEEGHRFAWHMKLRSKSADAAFLVKDRGSERTWEVNPRIYLNGRQLRKMSTRPDMILQFAHELEQRLGPTVGGDVEIRARVRASLDGRPAQPLIDPAVDLTQVSRLRLPPADWILPLGEGEPGTRRQPSDDLE